MDYYKVNGKWKEISSNFIKVAGKWKEAHKEYVKVNGIWKDVSAITLPEVMELEVTAALKPVWGALGNSIGDSVATDIGNGKWKVILRLTSGNLYVTDNAESITAIKVVRNMGLVNAKTLFWALKKMTSFDLNGVSTASITNMDNMFSMLDSLVNLDLSGLDTSNVTNMDNMFRRSKLSGALDISGWDIGNVKSFNQFMEGCHADHIDVSSWTNNTSVGDMTKMFSFMPSVKDIKIGALKGKTSSSYKSMFDHSSNLVCLDKIDTTVTGGDASMFAHSNLLKHPTVAEQTQIQSATGLKYVNGSPCP